MLVVIQRGVADLADALIRQKKLEVAAHGDLFAQCLRNNRAGRRLFFNLFDRLGLGVLFFLQLIDFLLRPETEARLAAMRSIQIPLKPGVEAPESVPVLAEVKTMDITFDAMAAQIEMATETLRRELAR